MLKWLAKWLRKSRIQQSEKTQEVWHNQIERAKKLQSAQHEQHIKQAYPKILREIEDAETKIQDLQRKLQDDVIEDEDKINNAIKQYIQRLQKLKEEQIIYEAQAAKLNNKSDYKLSKTDEFEIRGIIQERGEDILSVEQYLPGKVQVVTGEILGPLTGSGSMLYLFHTNEGWEIVVEGEWIK